MAYRLPPLNSLRAFEAAARHVSFQKAAEEMHVTPSALSYQIRQLEDHLGVSLFTRLNRAVVLTEAGERLAPGLRGGFDQMQEAVSRFRTTSPSNVLVVSSGPAFAAKWLAPRIYKFVDEHPEIELRISANLRLVDFNTDEIDVAVRFGGGRYRGLVVERLFEDALLPLASPAFLERFNGSLKESDLGGVNLLHDESSKFLKSASGWVDWLDRAGVTGVDATRGPRFSHADHSLDAAIDGAGVVLGRLILAMRDLAAGRLLAPFDLYLPADASFYFVTDKARMEMEKVRTFRDWLHREIGAEAGLIADFLRDKRSR